MTGQTKSFWVLQAPGWIFLFYLIYAQAIPAFDYELGVKMGTQEPAAQVTEVGVAFWKGFAFADLVSYIPLLAIGLFGHFKQRYWGRIFLAAALGISIYWPITCLKAVLSAQDAPGWSMSIPLAYWIVLSAIVLWSVWGLWHLCREQNAS